MHLITGFKGENHVTSANDGVRNAMLFGKRCIFEVQNNLNAVKINNNTVRIYDGYGVIDGRLFEIQKGDYEDLTINNGQQNKNRIDLIVARYEKNEVDGIENIYLRVIQGESVTGEPPIPSYEEGNILEGDMLVDFPLYKVNIQGLEMTSVDAMFSTTESGVDDRISRIEKSINASKSELKMRYFKDYYNQTLPNANNEYNISIDLNDAIKQMRQSVAYRQIVNASILAGSAFSPNIEIENVTFNHGNTLNVMVRNKVANTTFSVDVIIYYLV